MIHFWWFSKRVYKMTKKNRQWRADGLQKILECWNVNFFQRPHWGEIESKGRIVFNKCCHFATMWNPNNTTIAPPRLQMFLFATWISSYLSWLKKCQLRNTWRRTNTFRILQLTIVKCHIWNNSCVEALSLFESRLIFLLAFFAQSPSLRHFKALTQRP